MDISTYGFGFTVQELREHHEALIGPAGDMDRDALIDALRGTEFDEHAYSHEPAIVLYASVTKLTEDHYAVPLTKGITPFLWIRAEASDSPDAVQALTDAKPMPGEIVLNSIGLADLRDMDKL